MIRKIYKILFSLLFVFSSVFSMKHNYQYRADIIPRVQTPQVKLAINPRSIAGNSGVVVVPEVHNGKSNHQIYLNLNSNQSTVSFQRQQPSVMIAGRTANNLAQSSQHRSEKLAQSNAQAQANTTVAMQKMQISSNITKLSSGSLQREIMAQSLKDYVGYSQFELQNEKSNLERFLPQLKEELKNLIEWHGQIDTIVNPENYIGITPGLIPSDMTDQDLSTIDIAVTLKSQITEINSRIQWIDNKLQQDQCCQEKQFENQSIETLQTETIPALIEQECLNQAKVAEAETKRQDVLRELQENKAEQVRMDQRSVWVKMKDAVRRDHRRDDLVHKRERLQATYDKMRKEELPSLEFKLTESRKQLACAQKILDAKLVQEQQNQEMQLAQEQYEAQLAKEQCEAQSVQEQHPVLTTQEQEQNLYEVLDLRGEHCPDYVHFDRQAALFRMKQENHISYDQEYSLSPQAVEFLQKHRIDYSQVHNFYGTALQQQLHGEYCNIVEQAAEKQAQLYYQSDLLKQCVLCADAAYQANQLGQIQTVLSLNNLSFTLLEYGQAINAGIAQGVQAVGHSIMHPVQAVEAVAKAACYVLESAALNTYDVEDGFEDVYLPLRDKRNAEIAVGLKRLGQSIDNSTGPQRIQALTQFAVEFGVSGKIMNAVGGAMGIVQSTARRGASAAQAQTRTPSVQEVVASILNKTKGPQEIPPNAVSTAQKAEAAVQEQIAQSVAENLLNAEKQIDRAARGASRSAARANQKAQSSLPARFTKMDVVDKIVKTGGKIPVWNTELYNNTKYWLEQACAKVNTKIEGALHAQYGKMTQIAGNAETSVCMDLEHIVNIEYKVLEDSSKTFYSIKLKGGHLAGTMSKLEQEGLVKIESFVEFGGGCREYQVKDLFTDRMFTHTEFPAHWSVEKIAQETKSAVENAITNGSEVIKKPVQAMTSEGFELKIITDLAPKVHDCVSIENTVNRHIVTSHPYKRKL